MLEPSWKSVSENSPGAFPQMEALAFYGDSSRSFLIEYTILNNYLTHKLYKHLTYYINIFKQHNNIIHKS